MKTFVAQHKRRGLAVLISDLYDPAGFERGINVLRYNKFEPFVLHVVDPSEAQPELQGDVALYDCETGDEREVTVTAKRARAHRAGLRRLPRRDRALLHLAAGAATSAPTSTCRSTSSCLRVFRRGGFLR